MVFLPYKCNIFYALILNRRVYLSVAAAAIYMASQASDQKKTQKGTYNTTNDTVEASNTVVQF